VGLFRQQLRFSVLEPESVVGRTFSGRLYCGPKALWKFSCLRDFGYDPELLGRDEVEEKNLIGLRSVVKLSDTVVNVTVFFKGPEGAPVRQARLSSTLPSSRTCGGRRHQASRQESCRQTIPTRLS